MRNSKLEELLQKEEREKNSQSTAGRKRHDRFGTTGEARLTVCHHAMPEYSYHW
jgi:hypothetical protein